ncbi:MAG TPA: OsmC family protein [Chitinophagaceae bacterium]|jgi:organic hydroperoxide reductase OsmC/OhrA|nr:OsmC family protein [Chitinophagaceae bacterium]
MNYSAIITWQKQEDEQFEKGRYSRVHQWSFDGGMTIAASSSPSVVPLPMSDASLIDPEEAFLASLSSCHMLFFLSIAAKKRIIVERYKDHITGMMGPDSEGKMAMLNATLDPVIIFSGDQPSTETIRGIHELAHQSCYIASSVKTKIEIITR